RLHTRSFEESGGSAALHGASQSSQTTASTVGVRLQTRLSSRTVQADVYASLGWRHTFGSITPQATLAFAGSQNYTVRGTPLARDAALIGLGVQAAVSQNATVGLSYGGQFGNNGLRDHQGQLSVRWTF
ncbi:MAG: autotransporter domain-containing protein, partial [Candidimonas sp.]